MLKNPEKTKNEVVQWIRDYFAENGPTCSAVVGVSGGKDSSVTAALCAEALGADRVVGVLMPNGVQPDIEDSRELVAAIGIPFVELNIEEAFQGMKHMLEGSEKLAEISGDSVRYLGVGLLGPKKKVNRLTGGLKLYR